MQKVETVVNQFVNDGFMFTAWDVTAFLRKNGERIFLAEVKDVIVRMFINSEMGTYTRDVVDLNLSPNPFCYFHPSCDIANYDKNWLVSNPTQIGMKLDTTPTTIPYGNSVSCNLDSSDNIVSLTSENRLNISPALMSSIGLNPLDKYGIYYANNSQVKKLIICAETTTCNACNRVNADGRGRISMIDLENSFSIVDSNSKFKLTINNQAIEVTLA